ncbi:MAG: hypothetical protein ACO3QV_07410, partial [Candidatus Nanopelagicaceae bacterium]
SITEGSRAIIACLCIDPCQIDHGASLLECMWVSHSLYFWTRLWTRLCTRTQDQKETALSF